MHGEKRLFFGFCLCVTLLAGCTLNRLPIIHGPYLPLIDPYNTIEGPEPVIDRVFEDINLACLLTEISSVDFCTETKGWKRWNQKRRGEYKKNLRDALNKFYNKKTEEEQKRDRNRIQDHIIAASNQRCGSYKQFLKRYASSADLVFGMSAIMTAGAGAIFTAADTVRALSGISGILSGLRAETSEAVFQRRTIQIVTRGFEAKRREIYEEIIEKRKGKGLTEYSVERAIGDAILYHDHCSLMAGIEYAALTIDSIENPGIKQVEKIGELREALDKLENNNSSESRANHQTGDADSPQ